MLTRRMKRERVNIPSSFFTDSELENENDDQVSEFQLSDSDDDASMKSCIYVRRDASGDETTAMEVDVDEEISDGSTLYDPKDKEVVFAELRSFIQKTYGTALDEECEKLLEGNKDYLTEAFDIKNYYASVENLPDARIEQFIQRIRNSNQENANHWKMHFNAGISAGKELIKHVRDLFVCQILFDHLKDKAEEVVALPFQYRKDTVLMLRVEEVRAISDLTDKVVKDDKAHSMVARYPDTAKLLIKEYEANLENNLCVEDIQKVLLNLNELEAQRGAISEKAHLNKKQLSAINMILITDMPIKIKVNFLSTFQFKDLALLTYNLEVVYCGLLNCCPVDENVALTDYVRNTILLDRNLQNMSRDIKAKKKLEMQTVISKRLDSIHAPSFTSPSLRM